MTSPNTLCPSVHSFHHFRVPTTLIITTSNPCHNRSKYGEPTYLFANILDTDPQAFVAVTLNKRKCHRVTIELRGRKEAGRLCVCGGVHPLRPCPRLTTPCTCYTQSRASVSAVEAACMLKSALPPAHRMECVARAMADQGHCICYASQQADVQAHHALVTLRDLRSWHTSATSATSAWDTDAMHAHPHHQHQPPPPQHPTTPPNTQNQVPPRTSCSTLRA